MVATAATLVGVTPKPGWATRARAMKRAAASEPSSSMGSAGCSGGNDRPGASAHHPVDELRHRPEDVLTVVDDEEQLPFGQGLLEPLFGRLGGRAAGVEPECREDDARQRAVVTDRRQLHHRGPVLI